MPLSKEVEARIARMGALGIAVDAILEDSEDEVAEVIARALADPNKIRHVAEFMDEFAQEIEDENTDEDDKSDNEDD